ncbi:MAG: isocitrate/isopropylmalate dehydrogenase family protein [Candidatus Methylomirabilales bacterium]
MGTYRIAVLPGDGIGPEVITEGLKVLDALERAVPDLRLECREYPAGAACYLSAKDPLPLETLEACRQADAIFLGAMGDPRIRMPDGTEVTPQITLRFLLDLYAGVRPIKMYPNVRGPLRCQDPGSIDLVLIRENVEGFFASTHSGILVGDQVATDTIVITRRGTERAVRFAFELCRRRKGIPLTGERVVTCVDKANVFRSYAFFRKVFDEVTTEFPDIHSNHVYVDAMALYLVQRPGDFDVIVAENLFGDILSDLGAGLVGGLGMAPSADIGDRHAVFQPAHGSAPDIAGQGMANPLAAILSASMMLDWLGQRYQDSAASKAAELLEHAVVQVLKEGRVKTRDLGGKASTAQVGDAVATYLC